ncbi:hypothetical protein [Pantoea sp. Marseille-Q5743]|uniref:hypothetical protein n=1 Tax=Pantoea sp. Marseille-Q5743 TaxID=2972776 RepID=UPI0021C5E240|nr:hypothetical protein [Pantoea sp. Marseille-Q5743]
MATHEEFIPINNEVQHGSLDELAEELKAMRFAFAILYTQMPKEVQNGIAYQLNQADQDAAKRLAGFFSQLNGINSGSPN